MFAHYEPMLFNNGTLDTPDAYRFFRWERNEVPSPAEFSSFCDFLKIRFAGKKEVDRIAVKLRKT